MDGPEQTPLLARQHDENEQRLEHEQRKRRRAVLITGFFMLFTLELGASLLSPAIMAILEAIVCRKYYSDVRAGSDDRCDAVPIQAEVANIAGWIVTFKLIPTVLLSVPFGLMADTWGRKPTLFFSLLGMILGLLWQITVCTCSWSQCARLNTNEGQCILGIPLICAGSGPAAPLQSLEAATLS